MTEATVPALSPWALTTLERARYTGGRATDQEKDFDARMTDAINIATGKMEAFTRRALRARAYTNPITLTATTTVNTKTFTVPSGLSAVRALSPCVGANIGQGSRLDTATSDTAGAFDRPAQTTGAASVTFGSGPLRITNEINVLDQTGRFLQLPEYPVQAVYSIKWLGLDGSKTALDISSLRIEAETGRVWLLSDVLPIGFQNIEVECQAGYVPPSATELGDRESWSDLEGICLRLADIIFHDYADVMGRATSRAIGGASSSFANFDMPADVKAALSGYLRLWG